MKSASLSELLRGSDCEIRTGALTRQLYATDASIYQVEPQGVAFPRNAKDVSRLIELATETNVSLTPRGAGTGLVGGAIGEGLVLDLARHNRAITNLDLERKTVRVGAGVVLDQLNAFLKPHGYRFGPDVATSSRATLGGMIANNSSGSHVPVYGVTADHLEGIEVVFSDASHHHIQRGRSFHEWIETQLRQSIDHYATAIRDRFPETLLKRWPGYAVDQLLRDPNHLAPVLSGSEGTLGVIVSAELRIVPLPSHLGLGLVYFDSIPEAMQAAVELMDLNPAAIEHIDRVHFDQTRGQPQFKAARDLMQLDNHPCESILMVEFFEDVEDKLSLLKARRLGSRISIHLNAVELDLIWGLRKAGMALLTGRKGRAKPVTGIEDIAIPPKQLAEYVNDLQRVFHRYGLEACFYGHAAAGLLHVRPVLDLHDREGIAMFRKVADDVAALVKQYKGSIAAEHGVGMARTEYLEDQIGPELSKLFRDIKRLLDPHNRLNPGKIIDTGRFRLDEDLRQGEGHRIDLPFQPVLAFSHRDESFVDNLEQCNGCGSCRKSKPTMCPTFLATGEEAYSTRGRANIIRAALEWRLEADGDPLASPELAASLGHCLSCKACKVECPSNVDLALMKAELSHARQRRHGIEFKARVIAGLDALGRMGCTFPKTANALIGNRWVQSVLAKAMRMTDRRPLPRYAEQRFDEWFRKRPPTTGGQDGKVYLWDDTFTRYHEPNIGRSAVRVLEAGGFQVELISGRVCCGRPAFSQGLLDHARQCGETNLNLLEGIIEADKNARILFLEPSCFSMFVEDYRDLRIPRAEELANHCVLFDDFIRQVMNRDPDRLRFRSLRDPVLIHAHCHAKALGQTEDQVWLANHISQGQAQLLETGCCGMAGAFGSMAETYDLSLEVAKPLIRLIEERPQASCLIASGTSCRHQIEHLTDAKPLHLAEYLAHAVIEPSNTHKP